MFYYARHTPAPSPTYLILVVVLPVHGARKTVNAGRGMPGVVTLIKLKLNLKRFYMVNSD